MARTLSGHAVHGPEASVTPFIGVAILQTQTQQWLLLFVAVYHLASLAFPSGVMIWEALYKRNRRMFIAGGQLSVCSHHTQEVMAPHPLSPGNMGMIF